MHSSAAFKKSMHKMKQTYGGIEEEKEGLIEAQKPSRILIVDDNHFSALALLTQL